MKLQNKSPATYTQPRRSRASDEHPARKNKPPASRGDRGVGDGEWYDVEKIRKHRINKEGKLELQVKWEGYDRRKDLTWEPEESLREFVPEILQAYFVSIGGRQKMHTQRRAVSKRKNRPLVSTAATDTKSVLRQENGAGPTETAPSVTTKSWKPPIGSWEDEIDRIHACEEESDGKLVVYLIWKNGKKTRHETSVIYRKCPQKMLQFYEKHIRIVKDEH
ncbi:heterochromatin protein one [Metarhizium guizhouense ARSEF 977]|uniref:Heterochromatin protein one n=1 Tax=Metarhizium guizhouense (strain ARSEF 977) TaxID=1276136 RepID=A0A0B4H074_METGA|nr:heterochromatin protein one [Metarhizium guizhouense ARSEF 977]